MSLVFAKGYPWFVRDGSLNEEQGSLGHLDKAFVGGGLGAVFLEPWLPHGSHLYFAGYMLQATGKGQRLGLPCSSTTSSVHTGRCAKYALTKHIYIECR